MTITAARVQLQAALQPLYHEREAGNITELVLENITGFTKMQLATKNIMVLANAQEQVLKHYTKALLNNTPVQYVLHEAWFYGMALYVDEQVLIPRPETEELVDWLIKDVRRLQPAVCSILDIGTGSGCIPLAIKKNLPAVTVTGYDISEPALEIAKKNAADLHLVADFKQVDILAATGHELIPQFDVIISNPPYIPERDRLNMATNVLAYEPDLALFVPDRDPLQFYRVILDIAQTTLAATGMAYLEIHEEMGEAVTNLCRQKGFSNIVLRKDMQEKDRMVKLEL